MKTAGTEADGVRGTVVVVAYNARTVIERCLDSLHDDAVAGRIKTVVVDNDSTDGTPELVKSRYPWVELVPAGENGGFGAGNNIGSRHAEGRWLFFLNPDAAVIGDCIPVLERFISGHPDAGCVAPAVTGADGGAVLSHFPFTGLATSIWGAVGLNRVLPFNRTDGRFEIRRRAPTGTVEVDRVLGAAMMVPRRVFEQVGGFDERFFLYSEEEDLCLRIRCRGWKVFYFPAARVVHIGSGTTRNMRPLAVAAVNWSRYLYMRKHRPRWESEVSRLVWVAALALRWCAAGIALHRGERRGGPLDIDSR